MTIEWTDLNGYALTTTGVVSEDHLFWSHYDERWEPVPSEWIGKVVENENWGCPLIEPLATSSLDHDTDRKSFISELRSLINCHSKENGSNTPDFILASYLSRCLAAFEYAVNERDSFSGMQAGLNSLYANARRVEVEGDPTEHPA